MRIFEPHAHDVADDGRLRGDGGLRREGARRAGLLARPAAHVRRVSFVDYFNSLLGWSASSRSSASATTARSA